jgi:hypothetical protein
MFIISYHSHSAAKAVMLDVGVLDGGAWIIHGLKFNQALVRRPVLTQL